MQVGYLLQIQINLAFFDSTSMTFSHRLLVWSLGFGSLWLWYPGFLLFWGKNNNKKQGAA